MCSEPRHLVPLGTRVSVFSLVAGTPGLASCRHVGSRRRWRWPASCCLTCGSKEQMPPGTWKHGIVWNAPHICGESALLLFINYPILKKVNNKTSALLEGRNSDKWKGSLSAILTLTLTLATTPVLLAVATLRRGRAGPRVVRGHWELLARCPAGLPWAGQYPSHGCLWGTPGGSSWQP